MEINVKNILISSFFFIIVMFLSSGIEGCATVQDQNNYNNNTQDNWPYDISDLNTYGEWVQSGNYGKAWKPYVAAGWAPYENGHWSYADGNWTWISYEPFGWVVYHYGDWYDDSFYGWVWLPSSDVWSPARVTWVNYGDYVAWAPIPTARVKYGNPWEPNQKRYWHVVKREDFANDNIQNVRIANPARDNNGERSTVERRAPSVQAIRNSTGKSVPEIKLRRQPVNVQKRKVEKIILPPSETKKVEENSVRVKKEVLISRDQYRKKEVQKKEIQKKDEQKKNPDQKAQKR
jgi:Family of unknown function (DUF6600)